MKFLEKEILMWSNSYDINKYPVGIYEDLVINKIPDDNMIELMGAWKTGSLRLSNESSQPVYIDRNGNKYTYTNRWKPAAPVGYDSWKYISENLSKIKSKIPVLLIKEDKPAVLKELEELSFFGNIWGLFVLHCLYPEIYPLYDQHVYRAFKYLTTNGEKKPAVAPNNWDEYCSYVDFFNTKLNITKVDAMTLDRALWTYGKSLKKKSSSHSNEISLKKTKRAICFQNTEVNCEGWCHLTTLGAKEKSFWWKLNDDMSLSIKRKFKNKINEYRISKNDICSIQLYVGSKRVALANNVAKLGAGTEKDGIGSFLYNDLKWNTANAQLASHIAAIFTYSKIWEYNEKSKNMEFWLISKNWKKDLKTFKKLCEMVLEPA